MIRTAVLLDAAGIQPYIFGSTQLKENIGASYLVKNIYVDFLKESLEEIHLKNIDLNEWKNNPEINSDSEFDIGYKGGGNALLFFKDPNKAKSFVKTWTKRLLIESPGLKTAVAVTDFELNDFSNNLKKLFTKLKENKFRYLPQIILPSHGITAECNRTGLSAEVLRKHDDKLIPVSSVVASKTDVINKANDKLRTEFQDILNNKYQFPEKIDELGQQKGENNFISIVHIDGNGIGDRFKACKTLKEIRKLSIEVEHATKKSMDKLLTVIIDNYAKFQDDFNLKYNYLFCWDEIPGNDNRKFVEFLRPMYDNDWIKTAKIDKIDNGRTINVFTETKSLSLRLNHEKTKVILQIDDVRTFELNARMENSKLNIYNIFLPVRPIISGGDDVTFITDGRLGVYFSRIFIEEFIKYDAGDGKLSACAGIAITKSKYPFYRGYELAEQLCREAKKKAKEEDNKSSWLDFHIASGGFSGTITEIREKNYTLPEGNLCLRPYRVAGIKNDYVDYIDFKECLKGIKILDKWPRSKLMELREVLNEGKIATKQFITEANFRDLKLPKVKQNSEFEKSGWVDGNTPYFDMIDLNDFYYDFEIDEVKK